MTEGSLLCRLTVPSVSLWYEGRIQLLSFLFFGLCHAAVLGPQPGIEPVPLVVKVRSLNHWAIREVLSPFSLLFLKNYFLIGGKLLYRVVLVSAIYNANIHNLLYVYAIICHNYT